LDVTAEDFSRHYESLSDEALLEIDTDELTELACRCHADELARRGLDSVEADEDLAEAAPGAAAEDDEKLICIVE
jgi:hypothetical protein